MKNYYELLGLDPFMNYKELERELLHEEFRCDMVMNNSKNEEMLIEARNKRKMIREFESVLRSYGSKENYDRALKISKKFNYIKETLKVKIGKIDKKKKFKIIVAGLVVAGTIASGAVLAANNLTSTEVPLYPEDDSVVDFLEEYNIHSYQVPKGDIYKIEGNKFVDSNSIDYVKIYHKIKDEAKIDKITEKRENEHKPKKEYAFKYIVKSGDTVSGLESIFEANKVDHEGGVLHENEVVTIHTTNKEVAEAGQMEYENQIKEPELVSYDEYIVQEGDTLPDIAREYNVSVDEILKYNPSIDNIQLIYAGSKLIIPREYKIENEQSSIKK
mgnify:FL=1